MKKLMFAKILSLVLLTSTVVQAAVPEDCWKKHMPGQEIGQFLVAIDTRSLSKDELMSDLNQFTENLQVYSYDLLFLQKEQYVNMILKPDGVSTTFNPDGTTVSETQEHIASRVNPEIKRLMELPGVSINCFAHAIPHPGVSLSN